MSEILKSLIQFDNVPGLGVASKPHGINLGGIHGGRKEVPDHLEVNNGAFLVTADDTTVTVTNTSADPQSVGVLAEMWHSVVREFGASEGQDVNDSLSVRPYVPASGSGSVVDELVKVSSNDTTPGYLDEKLVAGSGVALTVLNAGADEDVEISVSGADAGNIDTGPPITVRGPINSEGASLQIARADHDHRLELEVEDEGALAGARPTINFVGLGVGAADDPGNDRVNITIPGNVTDGASVVRSLYSDLTVATSGNAYVNAMSGLYIPCPIDGDYWAIFESSATNQNANGVLEIGVSVNSLIAVLPDSERESNGNANDRRPVITTVHLGALIAGDLVRALFRKDSGSGSVELHRKNLTIFKVQ